jgi:hypothetical protein
MSPVKRAVETTDRSIDVAVEYPGGEAEHGGHVTSCMNAANERCAPLGWSAMIVLAEAVAGDVRGVACFDVLHVLGHPPADASVLHCRHSSSHGACSIPWESAFAVRVTPAQRCRIGTIR